MRFKTGRHADNHWAWGFEFYRVEYERFFNWGGSIVDKVYGVFALNLGRVYFEWTKEEK